LLAPGSIPAREKHDAAATMHASAQEKGISRDAEN